VRVRSGEYDLRSDARFSISAGVDRVRDGGLRFGLLGPLEVSDDTGPVAIGKPRQRAVLARLLLDVDHVVPIERIVSDVRGDWW
jgi:hypothetical protein